MSIKGIYTALSGSLAQATKIDTIANNIANVNTTGFKKDQQTFGEYLTALEKSPDVLQTPRVPASIESFYHMNGGDKAFVNATGTYTNFDQGSLKQTGGRLDFALEGKGFFEIATPSGTQLTRAGNFTIDSNGGLVTKDGYAVLMEPSLNEEGVPNSREIKFSGSAQAYVSENGEVYEGENRIGKISVVQVNNEESLQKTGNNYFSFKSNQPVEYTQTANPQLKQGFLESSNVNIVNEMTEMITAQRVFEGTQKAISAYDAMADKMINVVGNTKG